MVRYFPSSPSDSSAPSNVHGRNKQVIPALGLGLRHDIQCATGIDQVLGHEHHQDGAHTVETETLGSLVTDDVGYAAGHVAAGYGRSEVIWHWIRSLTGNFGDDTLKNQFFVAGSFAACINPYDGRLDRYRFRQQSTTEPNTLEGGMAETVDELTIKYEEDGIETVKELDKKVLTKGAWSTIIYRYQDWNRSKNEYGPDKYSIRRYQKRNGEYQPKSKFNISSKDQAEKIIEALQDWIK